MMPNVNRFRFPQELITGFGSLQYVGEKAKALGNKALIVTSEPLTELGMVDTLLKSLKESKVEAVVYDKINTEPYLYHISEGASLYRENNCDIIIGFGGGSPIDSAKAIGVEVALDCEFKDMCGLNKLISKIVPFIAIPTTAGTGSEVTGFTIITDQDSNVKMLTASDYLLPDIAICDPELTISVPKSVTAYTGLDALAHAIEAYISIKSQPMTDLLAIEAIRLISKNLRTAWSNGSNIEARSYMMHAATLAGACIMNSSVTLVHGMARPIGASFGLPHGMTNGVFLPVVLKFTLPGCIEKFVNIAEAMGENIVGLSDLDAAEKGLNSIKKLCTDLNMSRLRDVGVSKNDLEKLAPKMARDAIDSGSPNNNPRKATEEEIIQLYLDSY